VALVTGSGKRRVGWHVAEALAARGFALAVHYRSSAAEAAETVAAFRDRGGAVLLVSESLDEILALSDRIVCLYNGKIVGEMPRGEASVGVLGQLMLGQRAA